MRKLTSVTPLEHVDRFFLLSGLDNALKVNVGISYILRPYKHVLHTYMDPWGTNAKSDKSGCRATQPCYVRQWAALRRSVD